MPEEQANTGAERCNLRQRKIYKDHLAANDVQPVVNEDAGQQKARNQRPFHYGKNFSHRI